MNDLLQIYNSLQVNAGAYTLATNIAWQFVPPNRVLIYNALQQNVTIVYIARHASDLTTVNEAFRWTVFKAGLALFKRAIGTARKKYSVFNTPFGQIEIDTQIREEGIQELQQIEEELKSLPVPLPLIML